jgi:hypothetical protein
LRSTNRLGVAPKSVSSSGGPEGWNDHTGDPSAMRTAVTALT